jgi:hypothetical protein
MCGSYHANKDWYPRCISSWHRVQGAREVFILDDGSLEKEDYDLIQQAGHNVVPIKKINKEVHEQIKPYPALKKMRDRSSTFRKVVDANILFRKSEKVLLVDSDVYVRGKIKIPIDAPEFLYVIADVSGYRGGASLPIFHPMVLGFNAGFVFWHPGSVDLELLDKISEKYFLQVQNEFWTEQAAWSVLAGRAGSKGAFDGRDVCNVGGLQKRSPQEVRANETKWFGKSTPVKDPSVIEKIVEGTSVLHFPGPGKKWIQDFATPREDADQVRTLRWEPTENANLFERGLLALRMAWNNRQ